MEIREYDEVDPLGVLELNLLGLEYALTPDRVATIRRLDPRPFPFFAIYAIEEGFVAGQVAVYRSPIISIVFGQHLTPAPRSLPNRALGDRYGRPRSGLPKAGGARAQQRAVHLRFSVSVADHDAGGRSQVDDAKGGLTGRISTGPKTLPRPAPARRLASLNGGFNQCFGSLSVERRGTKRGTRRI